MSNEPHHPRSDVEKMQEDVFDSALEELHEAIVSEETLGRADTDRSLDPDASHELERAAQCLRLIERVRQQHSHPSGAELLKRIGRLEIVRLLGEGSYGVVYLAQDPDLNRPVAVKVPRAEVAMSPRLRQRFLQEAEVAASLCHPAIVAVHQAGQDAGIHYLSSAYCNGPSLDEWLRRHAAPLAPNCAARVVQVLAEAVQHAHSRGVLHRDLKPSNVMLHRDNETSGFSPDELPACVQITDFGLARWVGSDIRATRSGTIIGTPAYMSPEQAEGRQDADSSGSDIYSLGCILYELLTLSPPFEEPSVLLTLESVRTKAPQSPSRIVPGIPRDLEAICLRCLEKDPAARYASAAQLADDLNRFLARRSVSARAPTRIERIARWRRRKPVLAVLSAAIAILISSITIGSVAAVILLSRARTETLDSLKEKKLAEREAIQALYEARLALSRAQRNSGLPGRRFGALEEVRAAGAYTERLRLGKEDKLRRRNEAIAAMALVDLRVDKQWPGMPPLSVEAGIGFDGKIERYARLEAGGHVVVRRVRDNKKLHQFPGFTTDFDRRPTIRFSSDGRFLAISGELSDGDVRLHVRDMQRSHQIVVDEATTRIQGHVNFNFSHDNQRLAFVLADTTIGIVDLESGRMARRMTLKRQPKWLQFDPTGEKLAVSFVGKRKDVVFVNPETGALSGPTLVHPHVVAGCAWSHNGELLATTCFDRNVRVWNPINGRLVSVCSGHRNVPSKVAFAHTSTLLMSAGADLSTRLWQPMTGRQLLQVNGMGTDFSHDDRWLGQGLGGVSIGRWEVALSSEFGLLQTHSDSFPYSMEFSPDGRLLAVAEQSGGGSVWDARLRRKLIHLPQECSSVAFSTDGSSLWLGGFGAPIIQWPIEVDRDDPTTVRFGPPKEHFEANYLKCRFSMNGDRSKAVVNDSWDRAFIVDVMSGETLQTLRSPDFRFHSMSPDGRWVAKGNWRSDGAQIFDASTGKLARDLEVNGNTRVLFSPDGRWLSTCTHAEHCLWSTDDWSRVHQQPLNGYTFRSAAFSQDSRLAAVSLGSDVRLLEVTTGYELATLTPPDSFSTRVLALSPNGRHLAVGTQEGAIYLWQIDRLRKKLAELDLDWSDPRMVELPADAQPLIGQVEYPAFESSRDYSENYNVSLAFDNNPKTRWNAWRHDRLAWIARYWQEPRTIKQVVIHQAFDRITSLRIQSLDDDRTGWKDVVTLSGPSFAEIHPIPDASMLNDASRNPLLRIDLPTVARTRGIRIIALGTGPPSIWEVELQDE